MSRAGKSQGERKEKHTEDRRIWSEKHRLRRRRLGQNFIKSKETAQKIVREAGISERDLIVELGAGAGILTCALADKAGRVVAVEYDPCWVSRLNRSFQKSKNVKIICGNMLSVRLPDEPFRVVANIPFNVSTEILARLLDDPTKPLQSVHLLVQRQLARKHARIAPTTLKALTWSPWWDFDLGLKLPASAFDPAPKVAACILSATKRDVPLIPPELRGVFRAFVKDAFDGRGNTVGKVLRPFFTKKQILRLAHDNAFSPESFPSQLTVHQWSSLFEFMTQNRPRSRWPGSNGGRRAFK